MVRQENIETTSTATTIIPATTVNSDINSTVIIAQNNQTEPISSELINLEIINTLQKSKNLASNQEQAINPQEAPKSAIDVIMAEANQLQKYNDQSMTPKMTNYAIMKLITLSYLQTDLTPQEVSVDIYKESQKAYNNAFKHKEYQILSDLGKNCMNSYLTVRKFLGHPKNCKLLNGWHTLVEKKNKILLTAEWRENYPPPPKQVAKPSPVASISSSNMKKEQKDHNKGKHKEPATKTCSQGYIIQNIHQGAMENVFQTARTMMELKKKEEA
ncbi:hypothetical protein O181_033005 [Austropuccinia psidii MF-1]|uniref:Uncharacterized protein n=1 Tax=Austropuccinia psidii MF-1 TaxID=1389203 RepID=A0A9Q3D0L3_9BASI|nr:hypothetical protein [Austropuccinia psidii MF-1]